MFKLYLKLSRRFFYSLLFLLASCSRYQVTLNDRDLYVPPTLLKDVSVADSALETCISQTIVDKGITEVEQLTQLICTHSGIASLTGIEQLLNLKEVILSDNELLSILALQQLPMLSVLHLKGNTALSCSQIETLADSKSELAIVKPTHCR